MAAKNQTIARERGWITLLGIIRTDYISLTSIARYKNPEEPKDVVKKLDAVKSHYEFLGLWERLS